MFLPEIKYYISWLSRVDYMLIGNDFTYTNESYHLLDKLFSLVSQIAPEKNGIRNFWVKAARGNVETHREEYEEMLEDGEVENWEEFVAIWHDYYPNETDWVELSFIMDGGYKAIIANHKMVLEVSDRKPHKAYPHDVSEFVEWMIEATTGVIDELRKGTYNDTVNRELPPQRRVGTIRRRDMYRVFPEWKAEDLKELSVAEIAEFIGAATHNKPCGELRRMCANDFYRFCSLGYMANKYDVDDLTPKEQYSRFADGRDEGLNEIDPDSCEAFANWLSNRRGGGHPFEVCRGGNSTHIDLFVTNREGKYEVVLQGHSEGRFVETIKFYLALRHANIPVTLRNADTLVKRLMGEEEIGIVPESVFPRYCDSYFPGKEIISFMNLPEENRAAFAGLCKWQDLEPVKLITDCKNKNYGSMRS